jgi:hypothetical protein
MGKIKKVAEALKKVKRATFPKEGQGRLGDNIPNYKPPQDPPQIKRAKNVAKIAMAAAAGAGAATAYEGGGARMRKARQTIKDIKKDLIKK